MEPSTEALKADQVRALVQLAGAVVHFDLPDLNFQPAGLFQCTGWVLRACFNDSIEFDINGIRIDQIHWHTRPDAAEVYPEMHTSGFAF